MAIGAVWFLWATIWSSWLSKYATETSNPTVVVLIIAVLGYISSKIVWLPLSIQCGMTATVFVYCGVKLKDIDFFGRPQKVQVSFIAVALILWANEIVCSSPWIDIAQNQFPDKAFDFIGGVSAAICVIWIIKYCYEKNLSFFIWKPFEWLGKHSLIILLFSFSGTQYNSVG